jgi:hypothetical protein
METMNQRQEKEPQLTKIEGERMDAMRSALERIEDLIKEGKGNVEAARIFLEEVKGKDYRLEQAAAKLLDRFEMRAELGRRDAEIARFSPGFKYDTEAANDQHYDKYLVNSA